MNNSAAWRRQNPSRMQTGPMTSSMPPSTNSTAAIAGGSGMKPCAAWAIADWWSNTLPSALNGNIKTRHSRAMKSRTRSTGVMLAPSQQHTSQKVWRLFLDQAYRVAARVADHHCFPEPKLILSPLRNCHYIRCDKLHACLAQPLRKGRNVLCYHRCLPMPEIVGLAVGGERPAARWSLVFEEFNMWRG